DFHVTGVQTCALPIFADADGAGAGDEAVEEVAVDGALDEDARAAEADLALVGESGADGGVEGVGHGGVGEDEVGVLAAEFEGDADRKSVVEGKGGDEG